MKKTDKGITEEETILKEIEDGLRLALKNKLQSYSRETSYMPFQEAILGKKKYFDLLVRHINIYLVRSK